MKRQGVWLLILALLLTLAGCRKQEPEEVPPPEEPTPPPVEEIVPEETGEIKELAVELSRGSLTTAQLATAVKELPALLEQYLEEEGNLEIGKVTVTVGASHAATAETLADGNIDLAFLPTEVFVLYGGETQLLCVDAYEADDGTLKAGEQALLCAAAGAHGGIVRQLGAAAFTIHEETPFLPAVSAVFRRVCRPRCKTRRWTPCPVCCARRRGSGG